MSKTSHLTGPAKHQEPFCLFLRVGLLKPTELLKSQHPSVPHCSKKVAPGKQPFKHTGGILWSNLFLFQFYLLCFTVIYTRDCQVNGVILHSPHIPSISTVVRKTLESTSGSHFLVCPSPQWRLQMSVSYFHWGRDWALLCLGLAVTLLVTSPLMWPHPSPNSAHLCLERTHGTQGLLLRMTGHCCNTVGSSVIAPMGGGAWRARLSAKGLLMGWMHVWYVLRGVGGVEVYEVMCSGGNGGLCGDVFWVCGG